MAFTGHTQPTTSNACSSVGIALDTACVIYQEGILDFTGIKFVSTIHRITSEPFVGSHWYWPAVLVAQRLIMVSVTVFVNDASLISDGVTLVAFFGLVVQLLAQPYRVQWVNTLQTVASACLVSLTIFASPPVFSSRA